jgi:hypothetical protein
MPKTLFKQKERANLILYYKYNNLYYLLIKDNKKELKNYKDKS